LAQLGLPEKELSIDGLRQAFEKAGYICGDDLIVTVYLALKLEKPLLIEGAPGVGKTEIAKVLSRVFDTDLIRLQCYEGLDENKALYEWNYQKQLIKIQLEKDGSGTAELERDLFSREYLLERPLLKAIQAEEKVVLLIDEIDKSDEEFESFLFELLSDFQVSVPELGTIQAHQVPMVVLTSNRARELSDGLKRRCIFLYIDFPTVEKEYRIIRLKVPEATESLARQVARAVHYLRAHLELRKPPSISETLDWARALVALGAQQVDPVHLKGTPNILLKNQDDLQTFHRQLDLKKFWSFVQEGEKASGVPGR